MPLRRRRLSPQGGCCILCSGRRDCRWGWSGGGQLNADNKGRFTMLGRACAVMLAILIGAPALAGWINEGLSAQEAQAIKRLAVVSGLEDEIHGRLFGLTRFQNKEFDVAVPGWSLDVTVAKTIAEQIVAGGENRGEGLGLVAPWLTKRRSLSWGRATALVVR